MVEKSITEDISDILNEGFSKISRGLADNINAMIDEIRKKGRVGSKEFYIEIKNILWKTTINNIIEIDNKIVELCIEKND